jgi:hypothetical protein
MIVESGLFYCKKHKFNFTKIDLIRDFNKHILNMWNKDVQVLLLSVPVQFSITLESLECFVRTVKIFTLLPQFMFKNDTDPDF